MNYHIFYIIKKIRNILYGWNNWFKKYDFITISNSSIILKKIIDDEYYDRLVDPISDMIKDNVFLCIERPTPIHHSLKKLHNKNVVSYHLITFLSFFLKHLIKSKSFSQVFLITHTAIHPDISTSKIIVEKDLSTGISRAKFEKPSVVF